MKIDLIQTIIFGLIPLIVFLGIKLIGGISTLKVNFDSAGILPLSEDEYKKLAFQYLLLTIAFMIFNGVIAYAFFLAIGRAYLYFFFVEKNAITMPESAFGIPAMFFGMVSSMYPVEYIFKKMYREKYERYWRSCDIKYNFNGRKLNIFLWKFCASISIIFFLYLLKCTSFVDNKTIFINNFGSFFSKQYDVTDVTSIIKFSKLKAPNGNIVYRSNYTVNFKDGWIWSIDDEDNATIFLKNLGSLSSTQIKEEK